MPANTRASRPVHLLQVAGKDQNLRRLSLEGLKYPKPRCLPSDGRKNDTKCIQPTRRVVSEPPILGEGVGFDCAKPLQVKTARPGAPADESDWTKKPQYINLSCLRPQTQKSKDGYISILHNMHILVDFHSRSSRNSANNVMIINSRENQVNCCLVAFHQSG